MIGWRKLNAELYYTEDWIHVKKNDRFLFLCVFNAAPLNSWLSLKAGDGDWFAGSSELCSCNRSINQSKEMLAKILTHFPRR